MSEEDRIGYLREKLGHEAKRKGEDPHQNASEGFVKGHSRLSVSFGGNTSTKSFGKGGTVPQGWTCVCGNETNGRIRYMQARREICPACRQDRSFVDIELLDLELDE